MGNEIRLDKIYKPSEEVVARDVQGEFILIPITSGVGDLEGEIFSLNATGRAVWSKLDGKRSLKDVAKDLRKEFSAAGGEIEKDVLGIAQELLKRGMLVEAE
jgi:hypothetical protein